MSKFTLNTCIACACFAASCLPQKSATQTMAQNNNQDVKISVYDEWINTIQNTQCDKNVNYEAVSVKLTASTIAEADMFALTALFKPMLCSSNEVLYKLVNKLFAAALSLRRDVRYKSHADFQNKVYIVNNLAEDALYIINRNNPAKTSYSMQYNQGANNDCRSAALNAGEVSFTKICNGDVLVFKGADALGNLISATADRTGNFSHAAVAYIDKNTKEPFLIESLLEDGVKLRPLNERIKAIKFEKIFIYRFKSKDLLISSSDFNNQTNIAMDTLVKENFTNQNGTLNTIDTIFPYDFAMDSIDHSKLFCSEAVAYVYEKIGNNKYTPYPQANWSGFNAVSKRLMSDIMQVNAELVMPAPSVIDVNESYDRQYIYYALPSLQLDRINMAMVAALLELAQTNAVGYNNLMDIMAKIPNVEAKSTLDKISPQELEAIKQFLQKAIPDPVKIDQILAGFNNVKNQIPAGVGLRQVVFMGVLGSVISPKIAEAMTLAQKDKVLGRDTLKNQIALMLPAMIKDVLAKVSAVNNSQNP